MYVAGIDAHTTYLVVAVVSKTGERVVAPMRVPCSNRRRLIELLAPYRPLEAVVESSPGWPWLRDSLVAEDIGFVLTHATRLRAIAEADYKKDEIDAELLARMRIAGCIPEVYARVRRNGSWRWWYGTGRGRCAIARRWSIACMRSCARARPVGRELLPRGRAGLGRVAAVLRDLVLGPVLARWSCLSGPDEGPKNGSVELERCAAGFNHIMRQARGMTPANPSGSGLG